YSVYSGAGTGTNRSGRGGRGGGRGGPPPAGDRNAAPKTDSAPAAAPAEGAATEEKKDS
ncbi:MAG: hypothetical protein JKY96_07210, partial [Phycisphaerales bacterium]|nr:hypothetical protein [Phycisphaerales bacterium]